MAKKKDKNKEKIWNEYDSVVRNAMWPISPVAYLFGRYLYDKIAGNPTEVNRALYSAVNPAGDPPELSLKGAGNAILDMAFTNAKLLTGDYYNTWYKRNDDNIGDRVAQAAWAKYNNLPYDESLIIDNGDGTYSLPESVTKKIRTERSEIENAYKINKEKYDKIREGYRKRITSAIDNGNLEEIPVIQRERDNNDELKILEYAIDFDEHNLKGLESLEKNGYGVFNMFNTKNRNLRNDLNTDLNVLNDFTIRKNDDGTYSYEDMYDFFPLFHFLSNGKTFKIKGRIKKTGGGEIKTVTEEERPDFLKWYYDVATKKGLSLDPYRKNHYYDYELFWKNEPELAKAMLEDDPDAHFIDKYKMPGHPTFSNESIYSTKEHEGGSWIKHNGVNYFVPSDFTKQYIERTNDYLYGTGEGFVDDRLDGEKKYMLLGVGDEAGRRTGTGFRGVPFRNPNMDWDVFTSRFHKMNRFGGGKERRVSTDNLEYLYDKLLEKGYTGNQIYTLMANAIEESGGDPKAGIDSTGYAGLFQESLQRYTQDERDRDSRLSDKEVIDNTVDRIDRHIRKGDGFLYYKGGFDNQKKAQEVFLDDDSSLEDVMRSFVYNFERTADPQGTYINRINTARIIRDMVESNDKPEILSVPKVAVYDDGGAYLFSKNTDMDGTSVRRPKGKVTVEDLRKYTMNHDFIFPKKVIKYEDGGQNDIRNYYASRDNTSVGDPGYDLNAGNIKPSQSFDITETIASFLPGVGDVIDAKDLMESAKDKDAMGMALAIAGFIPVAGDAAQEYFRLLRESKGLDRGKRFIRNDIKETDDELLEKMPSYAHPNSPMADAMVFHKMRLDNEGYNKVVGGYTPGLDYRMRDLNQVYPGIYDRVFDVDYVFDPSSKETRALVGITYGLSDDVVKKMSDEEIMSHVNRLQFKLNANNPMFNIGNKGDRATVYSSSGFEQRFPFGGDDALNAAKSHELEHAVRNNADTPVTKEMADEAKEWFSFSSGNELYDEYMNNPLELLARGSQIKDYFGLTSSKQKVTPEMLKYFSRHYAFDVFDNDMTNFVKGIKDWDKAAKWISEYPTVYGGAAIVSKALEEGDNEVREMDGSPEMETGGVVFPNDDYSMSNNGLYRPLLYPYMISKRKKFIKNLMRSKYGISESDSELITDNLSKKTLLDSDYYDFKNKEYGIASLKGDDLKEFVSTYKNGGLIDQVDFIAKKFKRGDYRQFLEPGGLVEKQDKIIETLTTDYGIPDLQAVAIVANLTHESNLDPYITGDSGDSYGIQQWRDARRMALWDFARNRYHAVPTYEDQIAFLMDEFNHGKSFQFDDKGKNLYRSGAVKNPTFDYYQYSKNDFMNASNLYDAVIAWNQGAGRPSKKYAMNDRRFEIAKEIAERNGIEYDPVSHYSEMGYRSVGNEDITGLEQAVEENPAAAEVVADTASVADREDGVPPAGATQKERENWLISHYEDAILQQAVSSDGLRNKMDRMDKDISAIKNQIESDEQKESEAINESEQKRREREFLASVLSNVQLNIKGVSQIGRG